MNFQFGVDYYPEHWDEERWETDVRLMAEMGLKVVRIAEFAWQRIESAEGKFDFGWIERFLAILDRSGIKAVLGTPTASPPSWIIEANPDILPVDSQGRRVSFGGRHHDCQSNPDYRRHSKRIVTAMAKRFGADARVAGWQTDNEFGNSHADLCHCAHCRAAFHAWLEKRYGSVDALNRTWGTVFWSQSYDSFDAIPTPAFLPTAHSPSLLLDWKRFHSDLVADFQNDQIIILRRETRNQFVTHNLMGFADLVDYFELAKPLDFVSHDQYPSGFWTAPTTPAVLAGTLDLMAGIRDQPFWIMEQQSGATGWDLVAPDPRPGQLALWAAQSVAHGADTVVFFRWRSCTVGTEQFWHGILPHNGVPGRRYAELKKLVATIAPVMPRFEGSLSGADAAILYSYEQNWAFEIQRHHPDLDYVTYVQNIYAAFHGQNIPVDFRATDADLGRYRLVVAPLLFLELPGLAERLEQFVRDGGTLLLTMRTGVKDIANVCKTETVLPGPYGKMLGIEIHDYDCLRKLTVPVEKDGQTFEANLWWDGITLHGAEAWAKAAGDRHPGECAITSHAYGKGSAWYAGTSPDAPLWSFLIRALAGRAGIESLGSAPEGVELARRRTGDTDYLFALNHTGREQAFAPEAGWEPIAGTGADTVNGTRSIVPYGFGIFGKNRIR